MLLSAYDLCPSDGRACHELGVLALRAGRDGPALAWLTRALELAPRREVRGEVQGVQGMLQVKVKGQGTAGGQIQSAGGACRTETRRRGRCRVMQVDPHRPKAEKRVALATCPHLATSP